MRSNEDKNLEIISNIDEEIIERNSVKRFNLSSRSGRTKTKRLYPFIGMVASFVIIATVLLFVFIPMMGNGDANKIVSVEKIATTGSTDIYEIKYGDDSTATFSVVNNSKSSSIGISSVSANDNGEFIVTMAGGKLINVGSDVGVRTDNENSATAIKKLEINENDEFSLGLYNDKNLNLGKLHGNKGDKDTYLSLAKIDENGELVIGFSSGETIKLGRVVGKDGVGIEKMSVSDEGELSVTLTNGTVLNLGNIKGQDGIGIQESKINDSGELIITYTDGSVVNLGKIVGEKGEDGVGISNIQIGDGSQLIITLTDGTSYNLGSIRGENGKDGKSAFELYKEAYGYEGSEEDWLFDLVNGNLATKKKYTVTFDSNGGSEVLTQEVFEGGKITIPSVPTRLGYDFVGWFVGDEQWNFAGGSITENTVLKAKWRAVTYNITYDLNGGYYIDSALTYTIENEITIGMPRNLGCNFIGWTWDGQSTPVLNAVIPAGSMGDKTFVANWGEAVPLLDTDKGILIYKGYSNDLAFEHLAVDIYSNDTSNVLSISDGKVSSVSGTNVIVMIAEDLYITYGNIASTNLKAGDTVKIGDAIGSYGEKGMYADCYGVHVSLGSGELKQDKNILDYYSYYDLYKIKYVGVDKVTNPVMYSSGVNFALEDAPYKEHYFFSGWYLDIEYTKPIVAITADMAESLTVYAKYDLIPLSFTLNSDETGYIVIGANPDITECVVPATYKGLPVIAIANNAFKGCTKLKSVVISEGIKHIGEENYSSSYNLSPFSGCLELESVTIPKSVSTIHFLTVSEVFQDRGTPKLKNVYYEGSLDEWLSINATHVAFQATDVNLYLEGELLTELTITAETKFNELLLVGCGSITKATVNEGVTYVSFNGMSGLAEVSLPSTLTDIHNYMFRGCSSLKTITIPDGVTKIPEYTFDGCISLENVILGNGVKTIGVEAFVGCSALKSITLGNNIESIGNGAFKGCTSLKEVHISDLTSWNKIVFGNDYSNPLYFVGVFDDVANIAILGNAYHSSIWSSDSDSKYIIDGDYNSEYNYWRPQGSGRDDSIDASMQYCGVVLNNSYAVQKIELYIGSLERHTKFTVKALVSGEWVVVGEVYNSDAVVMEDASNIGKITVTLNNAITTDNIKIECSEYGENAPGASEADWWLVPIIQEVAVIADASNVVDKNERNLYLNGEKVNFVISYELNGGVNSNDNPHTYNSGQEIELKKPTKVGYTFLGWYSDSDFNNAVTKISLGSKGKIRLYAKWEITKYTITYDMDGGTEAVKNPISFTIEDLPITLNDLNNKTDYLFDHWSSTMWGDSPITQITFPSNIRLYAIYIEGSDGLEFTDNEGEWEISGYTGDSENIIIPYKYKGKYVTSIGDSAFKDCTSLTQIELHDKIENVGIEAFKGCTGLQSIELPNSVSYVGFYAFENCTSLTSVSIGYGLDRFTEGNGYIDFRGCTSLTSINVHESNVRYKSIDGNLYTKDGARLLQYAIGKSDAKFVIPNGVASIGYYAFQDCKSLTSVTIPNSVTSIDNSAFKNCTDLTNIVIPDSVTIIGNFAFDGCTGLTNVTIENGVETIGSGAFRGCTSLASIVIPKNVSLIGYSVFSDCTRLTNINVHEDNAFYKSMDGNLYTKDGARLLNYAIGKADTQFVIPNVVTTIDGAAFSGCTSLTSILLSDSFINNSLYVDPYIFYNCTNLVEIGIAENSTAYKLVDGNIYTKDGTTLILYALNKDETEFVIPSGVTSIRKQAFYYGNSLKSVIIPSSVTTIESSAFSGRINLTIKCEVAEAPDTWSEYWNFNNLPVIWNYKAN